MAKIISPTSLNQGVEVEFITGSKVIRLNAAGNLDPYDGVTMQALYSFTKEEWLNDDNLIKFPFPFVSITGEQFELFNGWDLSGSYTTLTDPSSSKNMIRDAGWAVKDGSSNSREEYMNITTLGTFNDSTVDQAYYLQSASLGYPPTSSVYTGEVNIPIRIYASGSTYGASTPIDLRDFFTIFLREQGKTFASYNLLTEQNISVLTYKKYALPLANSTDLKISAGDALIATGSPWAGMSINYYTASQDQTIGSNSYPYKILINGNNGTAEQIYEFVQYQLRQTSSIDANDNYASIRGDTAGELLTFIGDTLRTKLVTIEGVPHGVYIQNFQSADTNRLEFTDDSGSVRSFPFVSAGTIAFNDNLQNDSSAKYFLFFTNDDAGDNTGRDFGTKDAIIVNDNAGPNPITGSVATSASVAFDYDYDNNVQRGDASSGSDAPITAVAVGLNTAQYVVTTTTITRSTTNSVNFVASLERNYLS